MASRNHPRAATQSGSNYPKNEKENPTQALQGICLQGFVRRVNCFATGGLQLKKLRGRSCAPM